MESYILLKWGTIKGWSKLNQKTVDILQKWAALGYSPSCMAQNDTPEQKQLLCDAIDAHEGEITNDWSGEKLTKEQAKDYIMNYRKEGFA